MSVHVMSQVWRRYPNGGGEMLLALALADHAHDDGTHIYPSIKQLSEKTRQSKRTVQYQLRKMEDSGWLILVNSGNGGRNLHRVYRISDVWLNGADIAPPEKGAIDDVKGAIHDIKGATDDTKGAIAVAPASNHQEPSVEPSEKPNTKRAVALAKYSALDALLEVGVDQQFAADWLVVRSTRKQPGTKSAIDSVLEALAAAGLTPADGIKLCAQRAWAKFDPTWLTNANQQAKPTAYQQKHDQRQALINRISGASNATRTLKDIN